MQSQLIRIEELLNSALVKFVSQPFKITLLVSENHDRAHLTSDDLIRNAPAAKIDPILIGKKIADSLSSEHEFKVVSEQGFINIFINQIDLSPFSKINSTDLVSIFIPPAENLGSTSAAIRILSAALLQAKIAKKAGLLAELWYGTTALCATENPEQIMQELKNEIHFSKFSEAEAPYLEFLASKLRQDGSSKAVWFSPECLPRNLYSKFYEENFRNTENRIICPSKLYLKSLVPSDIELFFSLKTDDLYRAIIHLASPAQAENLSLNETSLSIKVNLKWFLSSLLPRVPAVTPEFTRIDLSNTKSNEKSILIWSQYTAEILSQAARYGQMTNALLIIQNLADYYNCWFNQPELRRRIAEDSLSKSEAAIFTVVRRSFSDILTMF